MVHTLNSRLDIPSGLITEIVAALNHTDSFSVKAHSPATSGQLDKLGCSLWNVSSQYDQTTLVVDQMPSVNTSTTLVAIIRAFAVSLLAAVSPEAINDKIDHGRLLKVALKATWSALMSKDADLALRLLEKCSELVELGNEDSSTLILSYAKEKYSPASQRRSLLQTYLFLRIEHARLIKNGDLAEHFVQQLDNQWIQHDIELTERAAGLFHDYAVDLARDHPPDISRTWLIRSLDTINACSDTQLQNRVQDLRISATIRLVHHLLNLKDDRATQNAWTLASDLTTKHGIASCLSVVVLELDVLLTSETLRRDLLGETAIRLTAGQINDETFKMYVMLLTSILG